jgi:O-antigen/teichoic acid export membrane protein
MTAVAATDVPAAPNPSSDPPPAADGSDVTGRDRLFRNVAASWLGHAVFIIAGFIMPRQIDRYVGQAGLGTWDFGWTAVNYFFLTQIGVGVAVNRYVARLRASGDVDGLTRTVSAAMQLQFAAAAIVVVLTAVSAAFLPQLFGDRLGDERSTAAFVIGLLGASVAVRMAFQVFNGVVTGCHRWDLHNLLNGAAYGVTVAGMLAALTLGGGLIAISAVYLAGTIVNEIARAVLAYRVCPELRLRLRDVRWQDMRPLIAFGAKITSIDAVKIVVGQLTGMLVLSQVGVATLAVYSRLTALLRQAEMIVYKFSLPLTPTVSSLQGIGRQADVCELYTAGTRVAAFVVWPMLIGLGFAGDAILELWMGPRYDRHVVLTWMAFGALFPFSQQPLEMILVGLNRHGRFAVVSILAAIATFIGSVITLRWLHWDLLGLAGVGLVVTNAEMAWICVNTCRRLSMPLRDYFVKAYRAPLACNLPFALALAGLQRFVPDRPVVRLAMAAAAGLLILGPLYWRQVLPVEARSRVVAVLKTRLTLLRPRTAAGPTA